jgi:UDPglucose--hexose-1-phosphate uridylyltransferase
MGDGHFLSDTAPEEKAAELRALSDMHYKIASKTG